MKEKIRHHAGRIARHVSERRSKHGRVFGTTLLTILALFFVFSVLRGEIPHMSELAFTEFSTLGSSAGSVIPASCSSAPATSHFLNDCTTTCWNGAVYDPFLNPTACPPAPSAPPTIILFAGPISVLSGVQPTLSWTVTNVTNCSIDQGVGAATPPAGGSTLAPAISAPTTYTLTCWNGAAGPAIAVIPIGITPPPAPTVTLDAPASVVSGTSPLLSWDTINATSCSINNGVGAVALPSASVAAPAITLSTTYTITCYNGAVGPTTDTVTVGISTIPAPTITSFGGADVPFGGTPTLAWTVINATNCSIDQGVGAATPATPGGNVVAPAIVIPTVYTISCVNGAVGPTTAQTTINITALLAIAVTSVTSPITLPTTAFTVSYALANGSSLNTDCRLLDFAGTPITAYAPCGGTITHNTPAVAATYGYSIEARQLSTSQTAESSYFAVTVNPVIGLPVAVLATNPSSLLLFAPTLINTPRDRTFTIANTGDVGSLLSGTVTLGDPRFVCVLGCAYANLAPGGPLHTVQVTFTPTIYGTQSTPVLFNGAPSPMLLIAAGTGAPVTISIPAAIDFGTVPITTFKELSFTITNTGLTNLGVADFGGYSGVYTCVSASTCAAGGINLAPGVENTVVLRYTPTAEGPEPEQLGTLSGQPLYSITINGRGVLPNFKVIEQ